MKTKIALFDDHPIVVNGIKDVFQSEFNHFEIAIAETEKNSFVEKIKTTIVDVYIIDIIADDIIGFELFEIILDSNPNALIICYTSLSSQMLIENLFRLGVKAYFNKKNPTVELIEIVRNVIDGSISFPKEYKHLTSIYNSNENKILSRREIEIIRMIANGNKSFEIAITLNISENTVESHRQKLLQKLEARNVAEMIALASKLGYLS